MRSIYIVASILLVAGCVAQVERAKPVTLEKGSAVDLRLGYRAAEQIWYMVQKQGCSTTDSIKPKQLIQSAEFKFDPTTSNVTSGMIVEQWMATGCGKQFEFEVSFIADGRGGTDIVSKFIKP